jgi:hypothetical protein
MEKTDLCSACDAALRGDNDLPPDHLVHSMTGQLMHFNKNGDAVCPVCGAVWWRWQGFTMLVTGGARDSHARVHDGDRKTTKGRPRCA